MGRDRIKTLITDEILGRLTPAGQQELDRWIEESTGNRAVYESLLNECTLKERYTNWHDIDERAAWLRFSGRHFGRRARILRFRVAVSAVVVMLVVLAVVGFLYAGGGRKQPVLAASEMKAEQMSQQAGRQKAVLTVGGRTININDRSTYISAVSAGGSSAMQPVVLTTADGSEFWVTLSDGTIVHLNNGSRLEYPAEFSGESRDVRLEGEAYFKVAHSGDVPFRVITPNGTVVRDLGTAFNVNTRLADGTTQVVLVEGRAEVSRGEFAETLTPGQAATTGDASSRIRISTVDVTPAVAWNEGRFIFTNCPLDELMNVVGRWYGGNVTIVDPRVGQIRFSGIMDRYASRQSIIYAISRATGIDIRMTDNQIIIGNKNE